MFNCSFLDGFTASPVSGFCPSLCHKHHTLQLECCLWYQIHLADLQIFSIFFWNVTPAVFTPKEVWWTCTCHIYMQMWLNENFLKSSFRLQYPELASIMVISVHLFSLCSMAFNIDPFYIGYISALLSLAGSWHSHTVPMGFGTTIKLLHHSAISSIPSENSIYCSCTNH